MAVSTNISSAAPYYDDFNTSGNDDKNYLRVLFKPGVAVQARELNQLQTALQGQIDKFGRHVFQENSRVLEGEFNIDKNVFSINVIMNSAYSTDALITSGVVGKLIDDGNTIENNRIEAKVIAFKRITNDVVKLFLRYTKTADASVAPATPLTEFQQPDYTKTFSVTNTVRINNSGGGDDNAVIGTVDSVGFAAEYKINRGVYFTKGSFVRVEAQNVYVDLGSTRLSYDAIPILKVVESSVDVLTDSSLRDNAFGTTNVGAPGADRYKIDLQLRVLTNDATLLGISSNTEVLSESGFNADAIKLINVVNSEAVEPLNYLYNELGETLAQRTFEESGNYALNPFVIDIKEHLLNGNTQYSGTNRGKFLAADGGTESKLAIDVEPSVAYVQGKRRELRTKKTVALDKGRDLYSAVYGEGFESITLQARTGNYIEGETITGIPDSSETYELYRSKADYDTNNSPNMEDANRSAIGTCKVSTVTFTGTVFKAYVNTISLNAGFELSDATYLALDNLLGGTDFSLDAGSKSAGFVLKDVRDETKLFPIGRTAVKELRNLNYVKRSTSNAIAISNSVSIAITLDGGTNTNETASGHSFFSQDQNDYIVIDNSNGARIPLTTADAVLSNSNDTVELTATAAVDGNFKVIFPVKVENATLTNGKKTAGAEETSTTSKSSLTKNERISIAAADIFEITSATYNGVDILKDVHLAPTTTQTSYNTTNYFIYRGETITLTSAANLVIKYKKFTQTTTQPFTIESYRVNGFTNSHTDGTQLEYYEVPDDVDTEGGVIQSLGDAIDFRATSIVLDPGSTINCEVDYYLPRIDLLVIDQNGDFIIKKGNAEINPVAPEFPPESMVLYQLNIPAYTFSPSSVTITGVNNRRYTMRHIGEIEDRIRNLEYYTALSLLERDVEGRQIFDDDGLRFNNGILVDTFSGHGIGDTTDSGYSCAVDPEAGELRPTYTTHNIGCYMGGASGRTPADRLSAVGIPQAEPSLRLPAQNKRILVDQPFASTAISVNPFELAAYFGEIELSPSSDEWKSTERRPDVITNFDNNLDNMLANLAEEGTLGTQWGEWEANWTGKEIRTSIGPRVKIGRNERAAALRSSRTNPDIIFEGGGWAKRQETYTQSGTRVREGIRTTANIVTVQKEVNDKVIDSSFIPFIRSRRVYFKGTGFKPNTRLIPFFDGINIDIYTRSTTVANFTSNTYADTSTRPSFEPHTNNVGSAGIKSSSIAGDVTLKTDSTGDIYGYFVIPNNENLRFRTGKRIFKLTDAVNPDDPNATTFGEAEYSAQGLNQVVERHIISTREIELKRERVSEREGIEQTRTVTRYWDPLAQSFVIGEFKQGIYLHSVDLYFQAVDDTLPVSIRLVKVENGIPTQKIVPFSKVTKTAAEMASQGSLTASTPTNFRFQQPVYLGFGQEYAIVVLSNSPNYTMWHSEVGGTDVATGARITKNPYAGVSFISQNASTWTPNQDTDYKMKLYYLEFDTERSTTYTFTSILPQNQTGATINDSPGGAIETHAAVLLADDTQPQGTNIDYKLSMTDLNGTRDYPIVPNETLYFDFHAAGAGYDVDSASEIVLKATLSTTNANLTPMIDLDRVSILAITNNVNNDVGTVNADNSEGGTGLNPQSNTASHGPAAARYVTKKVKLKNASTSLDVYMGINRPEGTNVKVYAQFNNASNVVGGESEVGYTELDSDPIPINTARDKFPEVNFRFNFTDLVNTGVASDAIEEFTEFKLKIVMLSSNSTKARVPRIRELRCLATV